MILDSKRMGLDFVRLASCDTTVLMILGVFFLPLLDLIHCVDRTNEDGVNTIQMNHTVSSPRALIKLFHRRSCCSCGLKDLYCNLKDNTSKRTWCSGCKEITNAK
jgi:hypothetical protein